jgi:hypothetical protein
MARVLFEVGTIPFIALGVVHALLALRDMFVPRALAPIDDAVRRQMLDAPLGLTGKMTMWDAWLGFNISHGLGLMTFGGGFLALAARDFAILTDFRALMVVTILVSAIYLALALRFFYYVPALLVTVGGACFAVSFAIA